MLAGFDIEDMTRKNVLYQIDPSGSYYKIKAWSNGMKNNEIRQQLEKKIVAELEINDAIITGLGLMRENSDIELNAEDIVVGVLDDQFKFELVPQDIVA